MIKANKHYLSILLLPLSLLYFIAIFIRNKLYDWELIHSHSFNIPIICIGNITVGGTGKTPHTEYLIKQFKDKYKVAVLSRGYGRKTRGFLEVKPTDTTINVGDEPLQIKQKFHNIAVAVDANRKNGISKLINKGYDLIILDDAYQHRKVKPSHSILLMDYNRLPHSDLYLPAGRLRDGLYSIKRANIVLVTKCPHKLTANEKSYILAKNAISKPCFFTYFEYKLPISLLDNSLLKDWETNSIMLITAIANSKSLTTYLKEKNTEFTHFSFTDHHNFTAKDLIDIEQRFRKIKNPHKILLTTEKDKVKLLPLLKKTNSKLIKSFFFLPIEVAFEEGSEAEFKKLLKL